MIKFNVALVVAELVRIVEKNEKRMPLADVVAALLTESFYVTTEAERAAHAAFSKLFAGLDDTDRERLVLGMVLMSTNLDVRPGRAGGVGLVEWFKGGAAPEPTGIAAKIAKSIREMPGITLPKGEEREASQRAANAYLAALASGECSAMPLAEVFAKFGNA
jgi:hypothetical protein